MNVDTNFGVNGFAVSPYGTIIDSGAAVVAMDHHDRIVTAGYFELSRSCGSDLSHPTYYFSAARFKNGGGADDGESDTSFGSGSLLGATGTIMGECDYTYPATAMTIDDQDGIVLGGHASNGAQAEIGLVKWNSSGLLDSSFGTGGILIKENGSNDTYVKGMTTDQTGRLLVATLVFTRPIETLSVFRFDRHGNLDTSFGNSGVAGSDLGVDSVCCIAVDPSGRIIVAGTMPTSGGSSQMFVARLDSDGKSDSSFGIGGLSQPMIGAAYSSSSGLTLDQRGRPIVVGLSADFGYGSATLVHFNLDGSVNTSVGFDGVFTTPLGLDSSVGTSVLIDPLGRPTMSVIASDRLGNVPAIIRYDEMFGDGFD